MHVNPTGSQRAMQQHLAEGLARRALLLHGRKGRAGGEGGAWGAGGRGWQTYSITVMKAANVSTSCCDTMCNACWPQAT